MLQRLFFTTRRLSFAVTAVMLLAACQSDDNMPVQTPDDYGVISFAVAAEKSKVRTLNYEAYSKQKHPDNMGVFGFFNLLEADDEAKLSSNTILSNIRIVYDAVAGTWKYANDNEKEYWAEYVDYNSFDFLGYMPYQATAPVLTPNAETPAVFTLSFPVERSENCALPLIFDSRQAPLICNVPVHETAAMGTPVVLNFDQTLTGFNVQFEIDPSMDKIRHFRIKNVIIYGDKLPVSGKVSRTYTWNDALGTWSAGDITWSEVAVDKVEQASPIVIAYATNEETAEYDNTGETMVVKSDKYRKWGENFYAIPVAAFNPTIEVTYDVELEDQSGNNVTTRQGVTSSIILSKTNFGSIQEGLPGHINAIRILIKPRYLYVLADEDKAEGLLLVD
ncbi:MAG: fimbrillin family protein [Prevotella sp.]